jgi:Zn-dependent peptidase ImmA (M78 family)
VIVRQATASKAFEPRHGRQRIDSRAWSVLERCRKKLHLTEVPVPVPVEEWIEGPLGLRFGYADLSHLGSQVLGAAYVADGEILIDERVVAHDGRCRFTCAHELGHVILHRHVRDVFQEQTDGDPFSAIDRYEREADGFAASFLMPIPLLELELVELLTAQGLALGKCIVQMMEAGPESEWLWRTLLPEVARRFRVSLTAALYRFHELRPKSARYFSLLPKELKQRLVQKVNRGEWDSIWIENGVPVQRSLFTESRVDHVVR